MADRKFIEQTSFVNGTDAARTVRRAIKRVGLPGHVWYSPQDDRVRLCAPDYQGEQGEVFVGVYDASVKLFELSSDIKEARGSREDWPIQRRTRSVTISEIVETTEITKNIPEFIPREPEPVAVIPATEQIQEVSEPSEEIGKLPQSLAATERVADAPLPALSAPAKDDAYGNAVWGLVAQRDKIDARVAELQLLRLLFDRKASDRMAFLLEDYSEFLEHTFDCVDAADEKVMRGHLEEARGWARRLALHGNLGDDSIFLRAAKQLRSWAKVCDDCGANDTSKTGEECRADAAECDEIAAIFEITAIKPQGEQ